MSKPQNKTRGRMCKNCKGQGAIYEKLMVSSGGMFGFTLKTVRMTCKRCQGRGTL